MPLLQNRRKKIVYKSEKTRRKHNIKSCKKNFIKIALFILLFVVTLVYFSILYSCSNMEPVKQDLLLIDWMLLMLSFIIFKECRHTKHKMFIFVLIGEEDKMLACIV